MSNPKFVYQLKVSLNNARPPIWRRILVPETITLYDLHEIIQIAMGWTDSHLHGFTIGEQNYGDPKNDEFGGLGIKNEIHFRLKQLGLHEKASFSYEYDFGDSWEHTLLIEKILPAEKGVYYPVCLAGKRACPPEDVGGVWGYVDFLQIISDPKHKDHDEFLEWIDGDFDPEEFDLDEVNENLRVMKSVRGGKAAGQEEDFIPSGDDPERMTGQLWDWAQKLSPTQAALFEALPLRRDVLTFLDYLGKNQTVGTHSTGNLPLKAIKAICEQFVNPPALEETINGHIYKVRSEDEVWPLVFVHTLAIHSNLVVGGQAQTWKLTSEGQSLFPQLPHPIQVFFLFVHWWAEIDWVIAFPVSGLADGLPEDFKRATLSNLCELLVAENIAYPDFADRLIAQSGLVWHSQNPSSAQAIMHSAIQRLVIDPMTRFGVLECDYGIKNIAGGSFSTLTDIRLTMNGKEMLELLK
jgi:hypothetical protein